MIIPVIMCGGTGSRLWPLSNDDLPKQFLKFLNNKYTLLQLTVLRFLNKDNFLCPIFLTNKKYVDILKSQLWEIGLEKPEIIVEPCAKNTAPAITLAALHFKYNRPNDIMFVIPSDSHIGNPNKFISVAHKAFEYLKNDENFILFGIEPTYPESGYGYIKARENDNNTIKVIETFLEKPTEEEALIYIQQKYVWNSGIFMFSAAAYLNELKKYEPEILKICEKAYSKSVRRDSILFIEQENYQNSKAISIDYAVLEKTSLSKVIIVQGSDWTDLGSWKSIYDLSEKDQNGNVLIGNVKALNCKNCYVYSTESFINICDISNQVIVSSNGILLNASLDKSQNVKLLKQ